MTAQDPRIRSNNSGGNGQNGRLTVTNTGELLTAYGLPPYAELTRRNKGWQIMSTSAIAALVVRPSTTAAFYLYNNNAPSTNIAFVIDRILAHELVNTDAIADWGVYAGVMPTGSTAASSELTGFKSMSGLSTAYAGGGVVELGATVVDPGWFPVNSVGSYAGNSSTVTPGGSVAIPIEGRLIIPPTAGLVLHVVASLVGQTHNVGVSFYEVPMLMGDAS